MQGPETSNRVEQGKGRQGLSGGFVPCSPGGLGGLQAEVGQQGSRETAQGGRVGEPVGGLLGGCWWRAVGIWVCNLCPLASSHSATLRDLPRYPCCAHRAVVQQSKQGSGTSRTRRRKGGWEQRRVQQAQQRPLNFKPSPTH